MQWMLNSQQMYLNEMWMLSSQLHSNEMQWMHNDEMDSRRASWDGENDGAQQIEDDKFNEDRERA
eukprot:11664040-Alexandrium_andersonii.AAC.1